MMAYNRIVEGKCIRDILETLYCHYYSYQSLNRLYNKNINPVIIDLLTRDSDTKPPTPNNKRQPGRPNEKRRRIRQKSDTTVTCSNCGTAQHNKKSCPHPIGYKVWKELNGDTEINESENTNPEAVPVPFSVNPILDYTNNERSEESFF